MARRIPWLVLAAIAAGGCRPELKAEGFGPYGVILVEHAHSSTAPAVPPTLPGEWKTARPGFEFVVDEDWERFESRSGLLIKRYGIDRPARRVTISLSRAELDTLFDLLASSGFFTASGIVGSGSSGMIPAMGPIQIEASSESLRHEVTWNPTVPELTPEMRAIDPRPIAPEERGLDAFLDALERMKRRRPEYRRLPTVGIL